LTPADLKVPLCERLTFVSIFNSNLDEFYMVRVGSLYDQMLLAKGNKHDKNAGFDNKTLMTAREQLDAVFSETRELLHKKDKIYQQLMYRFEEQGVKLISFNDVEYSDAVYLEEYFNNSILPTDGIGISLSNTPLLHGTTPILSLFFEPRSATAYISLFDYRDTMEQLIKERRKLCPVKLEYSRVLDDKVISALCKELTCFLSHPVSLI